MLWSLVCYAVQLFLLSNYPSDGECIPLTFLHHILYVFNRFILKDDDNEETNEDGEDEDFDESGDGGEVQEEDVRMLQA